jgi:hypothetical protein
MKKPFDNCTNLQGFFAFHAVSGGDGFGLNILLHKCLLIDYGKNSKLTHE